MKKAHLYAIEEVSYLQHGCEDELEGLIVPQVLHTLLQVLERLSYLL